MRHPQRRTESGRPVDSRPLYQALPVEGPRRLAYADPHTHRPTQRELSDGQWFMVAGITLLGVALAIGELVLGARLQVRTGGLFLLMLGIAFVGPFGYVLVPVLYAVAAWAAARFICLRRWLPAALVLLIAGIVYGLATGIVRRIPLD